MAIARGAGTEIIRCINLENIVDGHEEAIQGVQHHIYTVLSVVVFANALGTAGNYVEMYLLGYDTVAGTSDSVHYIFRQDLQVDQTFVWNDKFSFNGYEPTDFTAGLDTAAKQDAIADQASGVAQILKIRAENASDNLDIIITYIDQNNA